MSGFNGPDTPVANFVMGRTCHAGKWLEGWHMEMADFPNLSDIMFRIHIHGGRFITVSLLYGIVEHMSA